MRNSVKNIKGFLNSGNFKTILFVFLIASIIKLILNYLGHSEWYCKLTGHQFSGLETTLIYYGILVGSVFFYLKLRRERFTWGHIFALSTLPFNIYLSLFFYKNKYIYSTIIVMFLLFSGADVYFFVSSYLEAKRRHRQNEAIWLRRDFLWSMIKNCGYTSTYVGGLCIYLLLVSNWGSGVDVFKEITYATNVRDLSTTTAESLWENNKESLQLLAKDVYVQLSTQEKLNALQELVNIECEYLGVEPCQLRMKELEVNVAAQYCENDGSISISPKYVNADISFNAIDVLLHEIYHCYQYACIRDYAAMLAAGLEPDMELKYYRDCARWMKEFENYYNCTDADYFDDYYRYASQSIEVSANEYSNMWLEAYWTYINEIGKDEKTPQEVLGEVA